jgi:hypothetical protein
MKEKISTIANLSFLSLLFIFVLFGFVQIIINFSINDGTFLFVSVITPSLVASCFLGYYLIKAILKTSKVFKKVVTPSDSK